jgi:hypothetical protein
VSELCECGHEQGVHAGRLGSKRLQCGLCRCDEYAVPFDPDAIPDRPPLDLEALRRVVEVHPRVPLGPIEVGQVRSQLPAILAELERAGRLWRCGGGHIIEIEPSTPPYDMGTCPICAALERVPELERDRDGLVNERDWAKEYGDTQRERAERLQAALLSALERAERVKAAVMAPGSGEFFQDVPGGRLAWAIAFVVGLTTQTGVSESYHQYTKEMLAWLKSLRAALADAPGKRGSYDPVQMADDFAVAESNRDPATTPGEERWAEAIASRRGGQMLAYRGKEGCTSPLCTQRDGACYGWHCARCDEPCSYQGHEKCPGRADTPGEER